MTSELEASIFGETDAFTEEINRMSNDEIRQRIRLLDTEIRIMKSDINRTKHETAAQIAHIKDNKDKVKLNKVLPYLVANVIEIVDPYFDPNEEDSSVNAQMVPEGKGAVVKTSTRQTIFLPVPGLVRTDEVKPGKFETKAQ
jgi:26S proteasome regulatory subunit T5